LEPRNYFDLDWTKKRQVREDYVKYQKGLCHHCGHPLDQEPPKFIKKKWINWGNFPKNFLRYPVHLHHNHNTGMTIGAVHSRCNAVLWQYHGE